MPQLRVILGAVIGELQKYCAVVYSFYDWHEHDGFIVGAQPTTWSRIKEMVETERKLFEFRNVDFGVRIAIFPPSFEWLMRYNIDDEQETDYRTATCDFDLTVSSNSGALGILDTIAKGNRKTLIRCSAAPWFRSNYRG